MFVYLYCFIKKKEIEKYISFSLKLIITYETYCSSHYILEYKNTLKYYGNTCVDHKKGRARTFTYDIHFTVYNICIPCLHYLVCSAFHSSVFMIEYLVFRGEIHPTSPSSHRFRQHTQSYSS